MLLAELLRCVITVQDEREASKTECKKLKEAIAASKAGARVPSPQMVGQARQTERDGANDLVKELLTSATLSPTAC